MTQEVPTEDHTDLVRADLQPSDADLQIVAVLVDRILVLVDQIFVLFVKSVVNLTTLPWIAGIDWILIFSHSYLFLITLTPKLIPKLMLPP